MNPKAEDNLEELPPLKSKKEASYTYWVNNDPNFFKEGLKPETAPKKLESHEISQSLNSQAHSAWNVAAGTWEEKSIKFDDVIETFKQEFKPFQIDSKIEISEIKDLTGEVHLVISRGKKRIGYHLKFTLIFKDIKTGEKGKIVFSDFTDDGEREYKTEGIASHNELIRKQTDFISENIISVLNIFKN